jgi:hypothetical protein
MIEAFKIINDIYDRDVPDYLFDLDQNTRTKGNDNKLKKKYNKLNIKLITTCFTVLATITSFGRLFQMSTILFVKENFIQQQANSIMGLIRITYSYLDEQGFKYLFQALVRPHLEYAEVVWSPEF